MCMQCLMYNSLLTRLTYVHVCHNAPHVIELDVMMIIEDAGQIIEWFVAVL